MPSAPTLASVGLKVRHTIELIDDLLANQRLDQIFQWRRGYAVGLHARLLPVQVRDDASKPNRARSVVLVWMFADQIVCPLGHRDSVSAERLLAAVVPPEYEPVGCRDPNQCKKPSRENVRRPVGTQKDPADANHEHQREQNGQHRALGPQ